MNPSLLYRAASVLNSVEDKSWDSTVDGLMSELAQYLTLRASQWETRGEPEDSAALVRIARQVLREATT